MKIITKIENIENIIHKIGKTEKNFINIDFYKKN